ncbi:hypothetical protein GPALN_012050 [Globodera pallida]|nr:hypothetical protein GPALN_012050 [Globodera pallida]
MGNSIGAAIEEQNEDGNSKSAKELLRELAHLNHNNEAISSDSLAQMLGDVHACICLDGVLQHPISKWTTEDIKSWAEDLKKQRQTRELPELLAVACRACKLANGYYPRDAQIFSILLMLSPSKTGLHGHLQQIATGEGKTAIVALFVVVKALRDRVKIDVVTSSDALARRDAESLKTFYGMFGLTVDHCTGGLSAHYKKCYAADILYGDIGSFQGDILRHEFQSKNIRGEPPRPFQCIVIDEVDCILVDDTLQARQLKITFYVYGMEYLENLLMMCWFQYERFCGTLKSVSEEAIESEVCRAEESKHLKHFVGDLETQLANMINNNGKNLVIPPHLRTFALKQIPKWMISLKKAVKMKENCEYVIRAGAVIPVDFQNTGAQQISTYWSDGLHQFLQLKHELRMRPETLVCCQVAERNRAALILCLTNDMVRQISTAVKSECPSINLHKYTDDDEHLPTEVVGPKDVIFSTNYAGRGTDIKTSAELEANGGLHVIVTFMPNNSRVQRQAFGRTARQGKKGTALLILNKCDIDTAYFDQNMDILAKRDQLVEQTFEKSIKEALPKLLAKERLFEKFSTFIQEIRQSTAKTVGGNEQILTQIEEHWGFWLLEKVEMRDDNAPMPPENVLSTELDAFIEDERQKANSLGIFTNPLYLVLKGYKLVATKAISHLERAIELDEDKSGFAAPAHYYMALALIKKDHHFGVKQVRGKYKNEEAELHLTKAIELIDQKLIPWVSSGAVIRQNEQHLKGNAENTALCQQIVNKVHSLRRLSDESSVYPSNAVGAYQFIRNTLAPLVKEHGLENVPFSPKVQDFLAFKLLQKRGYDDYMNKTLVKETLTVTKKRLIVTKHEGKIKVTEENIEVIKQKGDIKVTLEEFAENLSMEWASFPCSADGLSYYHADGKNVARAPWRTTTDEKGLTKTGLLDIVEEAKTMFDKEEVEIKRQKIVAEKREKEEAEKKESVPTTPELMGIRMI